MEGINDVVFGNGYCTPIIAKVKDQGICLIKIDDLSFPCYVKDSIVFLQNGNIIDSPISKTYNSFSSSYYYAIIKNNLDINSFVNLSPFEKFLLIRDHTINPRLLSGLTFEFLRYKVLAMNKGTYEVEYLSQEMMKSTTRRTKLEEFAEVSAFSETEIIDIKKKRLPIEGKLVTSTKTLNFKIFEFPVAELSDIDGTITPADIMACCPLKSSICSKIITPIFVTARSFIWANSTRKLIQKWFDTGALLMYAGSFKIAHRDRVAGKLLAMVNICNVKEAFGNTDSDKIAFELENIEEIVIV